MSTFAPGWTLKLAKGSILGACHPPSAVQSIVNMWSVKTKYEQDFLTLQKKNCSKVTCKNLPKCQLVHRGLWFHLCQAGLGGLKLKIQEA